LSLSTAATKLLFAAVRNTKKLEELHIRNNNFGNEVVEDIIDLLRINTSLRRLMMDNSHISDEATV